MSVVSINRSLWLLINTTAAYSLLYLLHNQVSQVVFGAQMYDKFNS